MNSSSGVIGRVVFCVLLLLAAIPSPARADVEGARKSIDQATEQIKNGDLDDAKTTLQLAEAELDGVDAAAAQPLKDQIAALKKQIDSAANAEARTRLDRDIESSMRKLRESIGTQYWESEAKQTEEIINDPANKALLGEDADKLIKQIATMRKVNSAKRLDANIEECERWLKPTEEEWPGKLAEIKAANDLQQQSMFQNCERDLDRIDRILKELPADNDKVKAMQARYDKLKAEYTSVATAANSANQLARLKDYLQSVTRDGEGWEAETGGVAFEEYNRVSGNTDMMRLNLPKTCAFRDGADRWLEGLGENETYKEVASQPEVKAFVDGVRQQRDKAYAKLAAAAKKLLDEAEKATIDKNNYGALTRLSGGGARGDLHITLGDKAPDLQPLVDRANALVKKYEDGLAAADQAQEKSYQDMKAAADKAWPDLVKKYSDAKTSFDPNNAASMKGEYVRLTLANRMGWDFSPGDFPFAFTMNGVPVAAKYDPDVAKAIDEVKAKTGFRVDSRGDEGDWDVVARIEGATGKLAKRVSGEIRGDGGGSLRVEASETVDAPIITIVAAKCGALAVAAGAGMAKSDGTVAAPTGGSGGSSTGAVASASAGFAGWLWRLLVLVVGLAAAAVCLIKANFAPLASLPQAGQVREKVGGDNLALIGLVCAAVGVLLLLRGFIVYGMLTNLAIIAAGLYAAVDWLVGRGIIKEPLAAQVRPLGVPIGLACAALVVVSLLFFLLGLNMVVL